MAQQHIVLIPVMAHGHMIPMIEMAKLFISRGMKTTIIATPPFTDLIKRAQQSGHDIGLIITKFPPQGSSLPDNIVSLDQMTASDSIPKFFEALSLLQEPVEMILKDLNPNCLVSDVFFPWTSDSASKFGIPRLVFNGTSFFALCASEQMHLHKPYKSVESDFEPFVLRDLPHKLTFVRTQVPEFGLKMDDDHPLSKLQEKMEEAEERSYGVIINSFYELESTYADHCKNVMGKKVWPIGPLFLYNNRDERKESTIYEHNSLSWLDSKKPNSVVYMCFGSMSAFSVAQMREIAVGIEASGQDFIWVVRKRGDNEEENGLEWLLSFEERMKGKGLIIRGWAPQVTILDHPAIGAFVTHCGWNSTLEAVCAGMPMVTWPLFAEQFYNEKLVTEVLRIGVSVGNKKWQTIGSEGVRSEDLSKAVGRVMAGEGGEMRSRAKYYKETARKAVEEGGSSYTSFSALIEGVSTYGKTDK